VLFKSNDVGAIDLAFEPGNSKIVYASLWNTVVRHGASTRVVRTGQRPVQSIDGVANWQQLTKGLPTAGVGRNRNAGRAVEPHARIRNRRR
jgi:hypothetical protein